MGRHRIALQSFHCVRELKVVRDETCATLGTFGSWEDAPDAVCDGGGVSPAHLVSDRDRAIESAIAPVYGSEAKQRSRRFHLIKEYKRNMGAAGFAEARALLDGGSLPQARELAESIMSQAGGRAAYWCAKALKRGLSYLGAGCENGGFFTQPPERRRCRGLS